MKQEKKRRFVLQGKDNEEATYVGTNKRTF
jgi:hypothetical protein